MIIEIITSSLGDIFIESMICRNIVPATSAKIINYVELQESSVIFKNYIEC